MADSQALTTTNGNRQLEIEASPRATLPAEAEIRATREQIARTASQIGEKLRTDLDWKQWLARYPLQVIAVTLSAGAVVGLALPAGRSRRSQRPQLSSSTQSAISETGRATVVATVATNVATTLLREGAVYLARRFYN